MESRVSASAECFDELERHVVAELGVVREVDVGHAAAPELVEDLVLADLAAGGRDHCFTRGPGTGRARSTRLAAAQRIQQKKLCARTASMSISGGRSSHSGRRRCR